MAVLEQQAVSGPSRTPQEKLDELRRHLSALDAAIVCFSGGVDSALLLKVACDELGDELVALTALSPSLPGRELEQAKQLARSLGVKRHLLLDSKELENPDYAQNPENRCYFCKSELLRLAAHVSRQEGIEHVLVGTNVDDLAGHLPGLSAVRERGALHPLVDVGMTKDDVRTLSKELGLSTWDKPQMACLASRFPYGTRITPERLGRVEQVEAGLAELGFVGVRARFHDPLLRLELAPSQLARAVDEREALVALGREHGFRFVTLDLAGYVRGSFDAAAPTRPPGER